MRALIEAIDAEAARRARSLGLADTVSISKMRQALQDAVVAYGRQYLREAGDIFGPGQAIDGIPDDAVIAVVAYRLGDRTPETYSIVRLLPRHVSGRPLVPCRLKAGVIALYWASLQTRRR